MSDDDAQSPAASTLSTLADLLQVAGDADAASSFIPYGEIRIAFLPSAVAKRLMQLGLGSSESPLRRRVVHVLTRDGVFETRLRSIAALHARFPDVFLDVNHGIAINPKSITELVRASKAMWMKSHVRGEERGGFRRPVYAKLSRCGYRVLRRALALPKARPREPE